MTTLPSLQGTSGPDASRCVSSLSIHIAHVALKDESHLAIICRSPAQRTHDLHSQDDAYEQFLLVDRDMISLYKQCMQQPSGCHPEQKKQCLKVQTRSLTSGHVCPSAPYMVLIFVAGLAPNKAEAPYSKVVHVHALKDRSMISAASILCDSKLQQARSHPDSC